ncbi:hypothetical protein LCGC14_2816800 [marine sediment metagenome]|uniref:Uncharacterized protein n=1 Tax=marine sediment metagenome TaxID=412755 RepID=A0A0F9B9I0_9ZZZZ
MKTQREFFAALAKERNGWVIRRRYSWGELAEIRDGGYCPITAVAKAETGTIYGSMQYRAAANAIGLPIKLANRIARAADWIKIEPRLRKRILAALGLEESNG